MERMCLTFVNQFITAIHARRLGAGQIGRTDTRYQLERSGAWYRMVLLAFAAILATDTVFADAVPVRHAEGLVHGFLALRSPNGKPLADGQLTQDAKGDRVTSRLSFRFKD